MVIISCKKICFFCARLKERKKEAMPYSFCSALTQGDTLSEGEDVKTGFDYLTNRTDCMDKNMWS